MYIVGKGPIKVKDARDGIAKKNAQRKPKKLVETELIIDVEDEDAEGESDDFLHPEIKGKMFGDEVRDPFAEQSNMITFY
jgi:hypothetical protein